MGAWRPVFAWTWAAGAGWIQGPACTEWCLGFWTVRVRPSLADRFAGAVGDHQIGRGTVLRGDSRGNRGGPWGRSLVGAPERGTFAVERGVGIWGPRAYGTAAVALPRSSFHRAASSFDLRRTCSSGSLDLEGDPGLRDGIDLEWGAVAAAVGGPHSKPAVDL